jgi:hypothetical protein
MATRPTCRKQLILLIGALLGLVLVVSVWALDESSADHSFIAEQPCAPPCWYGLEPDKANKSDVYSTVQQLPFVNNWHIWENAVFWINHEPAVEVTWSCWHPLVNRCGSAVLAGDKLKELTLVVGYALTFETVVKKLGIPDYVDYSPYHPEVGGSRVILFWPNKGIWIDHLDTSNQALFDALRNGRGIPANTTVRLLSYSAFEAFTSRPGDCCVRIRWPGFEK